MQWIKATEDDAAIVNQLASEIFYELYIPIMPQEHISYYIDQFQSITAIKEQLNKDWEYYLLEVDGAFVGYLGLEFGSNSTTISKLYIKSSYRKSGAGKSAMEIVFSRSKNKRKSKIQLIVNRNNANAIGFYKKWGLDIVKQLVHTYPNGHSEEDYLMELNR